MPGDDTGILSNRDGETRAGKIEYLQGVTRTEVAHSTLCRSYRGYSLEKPTPMCGLVFGILCGWWYEHLFWQSSRLGQI